MAVVMPLEFHLPDLVIQNIIRILPAKTAVRMSFLSKQWDRAWCLCSILDFDEGSDDENLDHDQHRKFINILKKYLELFVKDEQKKHTLDKLRVRMTGYLYKEDAKIVDKLLSCSFERNVKELDITLGRLFQSDWDGSHYYIISRMSLLDAKSLTTLSLKYVRIKNMDIHNEGSVHISLLPSLKIMSLKTVRFESDALFFLIQECPSIEYLSLTSSYFEKDDNINLVSSSLKFLEVKHCNAQVIVVWDAPNLESFTFISLSFSLLESIMLYDSYNLKNIDVHAQHLKRLHIWGCHDSLKATITAPNLVSFDFSGYLKSKVSLIAPSLRETTISLNEFWDEDLLNAFNGPWKYFPTLADLLKEFSCSENVTLIACNFKVVIFPDEFRHTFSSPLPGLIKSLRLMALNPPRTETEYSDTINSLCWVAPSAETIFPQLVDVDPLDAF
ncbi:hypothetical protein ACFX1X_024606 [Malus domestica]|uniref:F-box domain-containing protein n=1 Tax=Malus domestica TaxID=3750 RepID=A0A498HC65_MALDO|nr:hypothetical protein DVH24_028021 [Malus domestica]